MTYLSALDPANALRLSVLERELAAYYTRPAYHDTYVKGINANWEESTHPAQLALCRLIPPGSRVLEVGCGDGTVGQALHVRVADIEYVGVDLNPGAWAGVPLRFTAASALALPFAGARFDAIVSMYVIEHTVFPHRFLDEAWRVLRPGGRLLLIAPDFLHTAMASERVGLSYGAGREKLRRGRIIDAVLTGWDTRVRIARLRRRRARELASGTLTFPILTRPRCLELAGFVPDCDAVYPAAPEEIAPYLAQLPGFAGSRIFYRDGATFGLAADRQ
jgi:SAM-dependent methyltransferase